MPAVHAAHRDLLVFGPGLDISGEIALTKMAGQDSRLADRNDRDRKGQPQGLRQSVVSLFDSPPTVCDVAQIVVDGDKQPSAYRYQHLGIRERRLHRTGVVKHAPRIGDVDRAKPGYEFAVEHGTSQYRPVGIARKVSPPELRGTGNRGGVVVERGDRRAEPASGIAEQSAAAAYVEKSKPVEPRQAKTVNQRPLCQRDALI